ncbi:MAG: DEAD/DEAH box helicase, partial [Balneolaceae bacterium]
MLDQISNILTKIFGTKSDKDIKKLWPVVEEIKSFEEEVKKLSDDELKGKTESYRKMLKEATAEIEEKISEIKSKMDVNDDSVTLEERRELSDTLQELEQEWLDTVEEVLGDILPEAYAVLKDTCRRFVGKSWKVAGSETKWEMIPYDVQLVGAVAMHRSSIAEMKTGEGKTLAAIFPAYLNALPGRGVHIVTVNNYLAKRDAEWNEPIFNFHGMTVDCVDRYEPNSDKRKEAYKADITYGTNNEFGFDYLRDNMVIGEEQLVQRHYHYAIIDEVDSILIDEARTPLIISGPVPQGSQSQKYEEMKPRVENLVNAQKKLVANLVNEAEKLLEEGNEKDAGLALFRAERGFPKNRKFRKMMQEPGLQKLVRSTESFYLQDNAKNMPVVDEYLYYAVDMKLKSIEMTEKG